MGDNYYGFDLAQRKTLESLGLIPDALTGDLDNRFATLFAQISALNGWATALATKLNADAGVTDTNYDTNPQA